MTRPAEWLERFWFTPQPPATLGFCRMLFFAGMLWLQYPYRHWTWSRTPASYRKPIWLFDALHLPFLSETVMYAMEMTWIVAMIAAAVGLFTRVATAVAFVCGFYLLAIGNNFGKVGHGDQALAIVMFILAISRCGDAWSIDALLARRRRRSRSHGAPSTPPPPPSGEYTWPIRMVWLLMALIFFAAGASKLARSGLAWITSDSFRNMLVEAHYYHVKPPTRIGLYVARYPLLCNAMAAGAVALELAFPLALLFRRLRAPIVAATLIMQLGIGLLMAVWFRQFLLLYLFWVPWDHLGRTVVARFVPTEKEAAIAPSAR